MLENVSCCWHFPLTWWTGASESIYFNVAICLITPCIRKKIFLFEKLNASLIPVQPASEIWCLTTILKQQWCSGVTMSGITLCECIVFVPLIYIFSILAAVVSLMIRVSKYFTRVLRWTANWRSGKMLIVTVLLLHSRLQQLDFPCHKWL